MSEMPEEAFQYFWFTLEILSERNKPSTLVADKCAICSEPLFCPKCGKVAEHKPYPKQAIEALIHTIVRGEPDKFFEIMQKVRHSLLHGEAAHMIEENLKVKFDKVRDDLGRVVWTALFNQLRKNLKSAKEGDRFKIAQPSTFTSFRMGMTAHVAVSAMKGADINNPQIEDFPYPPVNVTMLVRDSVDSKEADEYKPLD